MTRSNLSVHELNKRANKVFDLQYGDYIYDIIYDNDHVYINMEEINNEGDLVVFDFEPDMSNRPEALDYLLGLRSDFND